MDTPMDVSANATSVEARQAVGEIAKWWWAWLVTGILWIAASLIILQFDRRSLTVVGVVVGIMFLVTGLQEFATAYLAGGWKWLWIIFGVLFVIGGIYALINPVKTVVAVASMLGFLLFLVGIFWVIEAAATALTNPWWWIGLIAGFVTIGLGFWAGSQVLYTQVYSLLIFAGVWALLHGIVDIIRAFQIRRVGSLVAG